LADSHGARARDLEERRGLLAQLRARRGCA
jgi:hypothetical protein